MRSTKAKTIIVDDFQYLLSIPYMRRIKETGWDKYNDFASNYFDIITVCDELPEDVTVYFMTHTETLEDGTETVKLIGKLLREKICIEGLFTTVLKTMVNDGKYYFITQNNGHDMTKSPMGMFPSYAIDNDLAYVDEKIRSYYEVGDNFLTDEEIAELDEINKKAELEPPKPRSERKRRGANTVDIEQSNTQETPKNAPDEENNVNTEQSKPMRQRKSREQVQAENRTANAGMDQADDNDSVPFDEVETPEVESLPRRRRRRTEGGLVTPDKNGQIKVPDGYNIFN